MKKPVLFYISPCTIAAVIALLAAILGYVQRNASGGYSMMLTFIFLPAFVVLMLATALVKVVTKGKVLYIWIIETILVTLGILWMKNKGL